MKASHQADKVKFSLRSLSLLISSSIISLKQNIPTVARWSETSSTQFALGAADGRLVFYDIKTNKQRKMLFAERPDVVDLQWDPNSSNYVIACWAYGQISLIDADSLQEMQSFNR